MHAAAVLGHGEICKVLKALGASVDVKDKVKINIDIILITYTIFLFLSMERQQCMRQLVLVKARYAKYLKH